MSEASEYYWSVIAYILKSIDHLFDEYLFVRYYP